MSDFNSSLPVRTEAAGDVIAKIADATTPSQQLAVDASGRVTVKLDDGAGNAVTSQVNGAQQALDVGINVSGVQIDPRSIRALTAGDVVTANQGSANTAANGWTVKPTDGTNSQSFTAAGEAKVDITQPLPAGTNVIGKATISQGGNDATVTVSNALKVDGSAVTQPVSGTVAVSNLPSTADTNYGTVGASTIRTASEIGNATGAANFGNGATGAQTLRTAANLAIGGADVTTSNPVPVVFEAGGTTVCDYKDASAIAAGASDSHDYTVTAAKTLHLTQIESSGSGKAKMQLQVESSVGSGTFATKFAQFNSTATTDMSITLSTPILVAAGVRVRVVMTNRDLLSQDLYSTLCGYEI